MDIYAAQKMFGRGRTFDRIDLARASRAVTIAEAERGAAARCSGPGFRSSRRQAAGSSSKRCSRRIR